MIEDSDPEEQEISSEDTLVLDSVKSINITEIAFEFG